MAITADLKVLSSEIDPADIRLIKERGAAVKKKNPHLPHPLQAL